MAIVFLMKQTFKAIERSSHTTKPNVSMAIDALVCCNTCTRPLIKTYYGVS